MLKNLGRAERGAVKLLVVEKLKAVTEVCSCANGSQHSVGWGRQVGGVGIGESRNLNTSGVT